MLLLRTTLFFLLFPGIIFATPIPVTTLITKKISVDQTLNSIGSLQPNHTIVIAAETNGRIDGISVSVGEKVKKGEVLAHIVNPQAPATQAVAAANLQKAIIAYKAQEDIVKKVRNLVRLGTYPEIRLTTETEKLNMLQADMNAAELNASSTTNINNLAFVTSPVDGILQEKKVYLNMVVSIGTPLFIVAYGDNLHAILPFSQDERNLMTIGMPVKLRISDKKAPAISATITGIEPIINTANRSFNVIVEIKNPSSWYPGMSVEGKVIVGTKDVIQVPLMSVVYFDDRPFVFVIDKQQIAKKVPVQMEFSNDQTALITQGLTPGERVVVDGANQLDDGDKVLLQ